MLSFDSGFGGLVEGVSRSLVKVEGNGRAYGIASPELLLRTDDGTTSLGGVESGLSSDDGLTLSSTAARL